MTVLAKYFMWSVYTGYLFHTFMRLALFLVTYIYFANFHIEFTHLLNFLFNHYPVVVLSIK